MYDLRFVGILLLCCSGLNIFARSPAINAINRICRVLFYIFLSFFSVVLIPITLLNLNKIGYNVISLAYISVCISCHFTIKRAINDLRDTIKTLNVLLDRERLEFLTTLDKWAGLSGLLIGEFNAAIMSAVMLLTPVSSSMDPISKSLLANYKFVMPIAIHAYIFFIFGSTLSSMVLYSNLAICFGQLAEQFDDQIKLIARQIDCDWSARTCEQIRQVRKFLRIYWELKVNCVRQLANLPGLWFAYYFVALTGD